MAPVTQAGNILRASRRRLGYNYTIYGCHRPHGLPCMGQPATIHLLNIGIEIMKKSLLALAVLSVLAGCQTAPTTEGDPQVNKTVVGGIIGAVGGALAADKEHRMEGAVIGAAIGGGVGYYMDRQERAFRDALSEQERTHEIEIERVRDDLLKLSLSGEASFDYDKATIKPAFQSTLNDLAGVIQKYDRTKVWVVGHTDSTGSDAYNQQLSERRAAAVGDYLARRGVSWSRMTTEGKGESEPRADNATEAGRQLNRRVEILIQPTEKQ